MPECGSLVLGEHRFCVKCGAKLDSAESEYMNVSGEKQRAQDNVSEKESSVRISNASEVDKKFQIIGIVILVVFLLFVLILFSRNNSSTLDNQISNSSNFSRKTTIKDIDNKLNVWSFTDELDGMIKNYFEKDNRYVGKYNIDYTLIPTDQFPNKLDPVLASGSECPDVFALDDAFVRKYVESGLLLDLTDIYNEIKDKMIAYPAEVGTYNEKVYALSYHVVPGVVFYRRSLAKKYLGTDDPVEVQKRLADWDKFLETAELIKNRSNGNCYIVSSTGDIFKPYSAGRKNPWVVNDRLVIDPIMEDYMEMCKTLKNRGLEGRVGQWSEEWFAGMKGILADESGNIKEVFSYFLPPWGLHYVLKTNAPETSGDWAMVKGPTSWYWGGSWVGAWAKTKNPNAAKELIKYIATDDAFLEIWAKDTGDVVSNAKVVNKVKNFFYEPFLGGQNHYAEFAEIAKSVDGKLSQGTDQYIEWRFNEAVDTYIYGKKSKSQALVDFRNLVITDLSWIN